mmetsp:Transcript_11157/g.18737  ORF Transcript_11157/g.18737 Transcript_11157/m.18737 type:complete len:236 (-) Transcript_11157:1404-2111(-)
MESFSLLAVRLLFLLLLPELLLKSDPLIVVDVAVLSLEVVVVVLLEILDLLIIDVVLRGVDLYFLLEAFEPGLPRQVVQEGLTARALQSLDLHDLVALLSDVEEVGGVGYVSDVGAVIIGVHDEDGQLLLQPVLLQLVAQRHHEHFSVVTALTAVLHDLEEELVDLLVLDHVALKGLRVHLHDKLAAHVPVVLDGQGCRRSLKVLVDQLVHLDVEELLVVELALRSRLLLLCALL